ncbi:hypothetical protein Taro_042342 [Colocasia esculenta]|uniref:Uncharacterized protein n=1 Tax=Colocasia esculenta TaxID=4460 RepID=A0A843WI72_COLES|nr:hypothetical protein [Colocasia esculenta]
MRRGVNSRPQYPRVPRYFLHHHLWTTTYSCDADAGTDSGCVAGSVADTGSSSSSSSTGAWDGGLSIMERFKRMVLEYKARFAELSKYAPHIVVDDHRKAKKFVMGLKPSLRSRLVAFDHRILDKALSAACRQEGEMDQYIEEERAAQKRIVAPFQRQDRKKAVVYQQPQHSVAAPS